MFEKVKDLNLPNGKYAVFGSGPMVVKGLREGRDIDIIASKDIFEEYKNKPG